MGRVNRQEDHTPGVGVQLFSVQLPSQGKYTGTHQSEKGGTHNRDTQALKPHIQLRYFYKSKSAMLCCHIQTASVDVPSPIHRILDLLAFTERCKEQRKLDSCLWMFWRLQRDA